MIDFKKYQIWLLTGSQHLYGADILKNVERHAIEISQALTLSPHIPISINFHSVVTSSEQILDVCQKANNSNGCIGLIVWMHTFSPAKMWIRGLDSLNKPFAHLHTQYNMEIPWSDIDMDFMNENQSAHGDREFGYIATRMRKNRKVIAGHWQEDNVRIQIGTWIRAALGWHAFQNTRVARIGDNMREVAVTEGDKVEAQIRFGFSVTGFGSGDLAVHIDRVSDKQAAELVTLYQESYHMTAEVGSSRSILEAARIELGLRSFLKQGGFNAFTDTFENLHGIEQLPGISTQRLMAEGYGFGAEGDWKTAALLRAVKVMDTGLAGGSSFMEDYTYHFKQGKSLVLGAHMLEICPSIASGKPKCEVHPLSIGGKADPARLTFDVDEGPAINVSLIDLGNRFRILINEVEVVKPEQPLPKLPVARVLWDPKPNLVTSAQCWITAGGAHHTVFSKALNTQILEDFAEIAGVELVVIDGNTNYREFKDRLKWNEVYYHLFQNRL
ncbi:MAG: L-arabinose isomerase [Cyclobacteriaceae bacterium]|nr:MAG: L-arabinose isomerase [Cyclobacteriaceae bacterium]